MSSSAIGSNLMSEYVSMQHRAVLRVEHAQTEDSTDQISGEYSYGVLMSMPQFLSWFMGGTSSSQVTDETR